jgi:hypothetical protein
MRNPDQLRHAELLLGKVASGCHRNGTGTIGLAWDMGRHGKSIGDACPRSARQDIVIQACHLEHAWDRRPGAADTIHIARAMDRVDRPSFCSPKYATQDSG